MRAKTINEENSMDIPNSFMSGNELIDDNELVKESLSNPELWDPTVMEKLLDEFEEKVHSLDETEWEEIQDIKHALWIGYTNKPTPHSSGLRHGPRGDMDSESWGDPPDWRDNEMGR